MQVVARRRDEFSAHLTCDTVLLGLLYIVVFIEIKSRRVIHSACTYKPDSAWACQQARNLCLQLQDLEMPISLVIHDRDSKFGSGFDAILKDEGAKIALPPCQAPRANAVAERVVKTLRTECLDFLIIFGESHLARVLKNSLTITTGDVLTAASG
jgi:transposase InsO family protein